MTDANPNDTTTSPLPPTFPPDAGAGASTIGGSESHDLGPSSEAVVPGQQAPAPAPTGAPNVATADAERVGVDLPAPEPAPEPEVPEDRLAVGSHVVVDRPGLGTGPQYGVVVEAVVLPGATEPAYRVGWLAGADRLYTESDLTTTREYAERQADDGR